MIPTPRGPSWALLPLLVFIVFSGCQQNDRSGPAGGVEDRQPLRAVSGWTWYHSEPIGYTIRMPNTFRRAGARGAATRIYTSPDGVVQVTLTSELVDGNPSMRRLMQRQRRDRAQQGEVTAAASGARDLEIEAVIDGIVYLEKASHRDGRLIWLEVRYPEAQRETAAEVARAIASSFPDGDTLEVVTARR